MLPVALPLLLGLPIHLAEQKRLPSLQRAALKRFPSREQAYPSYGGSIGDWVVGGVWVKNWTNLPVGLGTACPTAGAPLYSHSIGNSGGEMLQNGSGIIDSWEFLWFASKVSTTNGVACLSVSMTNATTPIFYGPVLYFIPHSLMTDDEISAFAITMGSQDTNCPVGSVCNITGHPVSADVYTLRSTVAPTGASGISQLYMDSTSNWPTMKPNSNNAYPVALFTGTITNGNNVCATGTSGAITTLGCTGGGGNVIVAPQYYGAYYSGPGTTNQISGMAWSTSVNGVPQTAVEISSAGLLTTPQAAFSGVPGRPLSGSGPISDTILATDRTNRVEYNNTSTTAVNLPAAGTSGFANNFVMKTKARGAGGVVTFTPGANSINGSGTLVVNQGTDCTIGSQDNLNYWADCHDPPLIAGTNITLTRGDYGITVSSTAGGGTVTHTLGALTSGQLMCGNGAADSKVCDIYWGRHQTSGTTALTCY